MDYMTIIIINMNKIITILLPNKPPTPPTPPTILLLLLLYRILCCLLTRNYEYPDEYWQGNEIAHYIHYGYGYRTWEWTISEPIRNPLYPFVLSWAYFVPDVMGDGVFWVHLPRVVVQVGVAVVGDWYLLRILGVLYGGRISGLGLACIFGNWYYAGTMVRVYYNSFQTAAFVVALYYWLISGRIGLNNREDFINRVIVVISYVSRPTSIMMWAIIWPYQLYGLIKIHNSISKPVLKFILKNILTILLMISLSFLVGSISNGKPILTQLNFIKYNIIEKWSQLYGKQPFWYYFIISVPFACGTGLLLLALSLLKLWLAQRSQGLAVEVQEKKGRSDMKVLVGIAIAYLGISSLSGHKEHRFIFPVIPLILILSVYCLKQPGKDSVGKIKTSILRPITYFTLILNIFLFWQFNFYGKSDGPSAWQYIGTKLPPSPAKDPSISVIVLGQSHFLPPAYSTLHRNITYRIPDSSAVKMSVNASDHNLLRADPYKLYRKLTENGTFVPDFVIAQGKYLPYTADLLGELGFMEVRSWRHCTVFQEIFLGYDSISVMERPIK